jgi:hypothetical protein
VEDERRLQCAAAAAPRGDPSPPAADKHRCWRAVATTCAGSSALPRRMSADSSMRQPRPVRGAWPSGGGRAPALAARAGSSALRQRTGLRCRPTTVGSRRTTGSASPGGGRASARGPPVGKCGGARRAGWNRMQRPGRLDAMSFFLPFVICNSE